ncbi:MAG: zinc ribbon domain-containing protein [Coriobacteriales bacterium]|nr:zinc ribbon domain-containing protein [Coriobacteriales bacterium]
MGIMDGIQSGLNRGMAATSRATRSMQLKSTLSTLDKQRGEQLAQLGASLYEQTRSDAAIREPREAIFSAIESLDVQRAAVLDELAQLERASQQQQMASQQIPCPNCGKPIPANSAFCVGCGANLAQAYASAGQCSACGAPLAPGVAFCTACGTPVQ